MNQNFKNYSYYFASQWSGWSIFNKLFIFLCKSFSISLISWIIL